MFKSDNAKGNNASETQILTQIMFQQMLHGLSVQLQVGYGGHFLLPGRRLPRHGGHLHDGMGGECTRINL